MDWLGHDARAVAVNCGHSIPGLTVVMKGGAESF
jgi:hypothetical protein